MSQNTSSETSGPFGAATLVTTLPAAKVAAMYLAEYDVDIAAQFGSTDVLSLYRDEATGMLFWRPTSLAGDEHFYQQLSNAWSGYYKEWRWEYALMSPLLAGTASLLEVGCGQGYFLRHTEGKVGDALGIELNNEAIANKVTSWPVIAAKVEDMASDPSRRFDVVCAFQVLEHVSDPAGFLRDCLACTKPGGRVAVSIPNHENITFQQRRDPLDLPPHHLNHFTPAVFERMAPLLGASIDRIHTQRAQFGLPPVTAGTRATRSYRLARKIANRAFTKIYDRQREPGHTMLAVLRKPA